MITNENSENVVKTSRTEPFTVAIVGIGLIGGSMAIALKDKGFATKVIGVEADETHRQKALQLGLVDEVWDLTEAVQQADLIVLAVPVGICMKLLPEILDNVEKQVVIDVGSTKQG